MVDRGRGVEQNQRDAEDAGRNDAIGIGAGSEDHHDQCDDGKHCANGVGDLTGIFLVPSVTQGRALAEGDGGHAEKLGMERASVHAGMLSLRSK